MTSPADTVEHELKCWPEFFAEVIAGRKTFEIRQEDDRIFNVGDSLLLREYDPKSDSYSGRTWAGSITYKTDWMQKDGIAVLGIKPKQERSTADTVEEVMRLPEPALPVAYYCNKCGYLGPVGESHFVSGAVGDGGNPVMCNYLAVPSGPYWDRTAVEKLVAERDEAKKAAYGARLLIADVIADRDRLAAQVEELRKAGLASGTPVAWGYKQGGEFVRFTHLPATGMNGIPLYTAPQITPEDREWANRLVSMIEQGFATGEVFEFAKAAALLRKAYLQEKPE